MTPINFITHTPEAARSEPLPTIPVSNALLAYVIMNDSEVSQVFVGPSGVDIAKLRQTWREGIIATLPTEPPKEFILVEGEQYLSPAWLKKVRDRDQMISLATREAFFLKWLHDERGFKKINFQESY